MFASRSIQRIVCICLFGTTGLAICQTKADLIAERQAALTLEQQGKLDAAEAAWRSLSKAVPSNPEPYARLGLLEARQEHYKEAVPLYRKALALDPKKPELKMNLGLALFKGGEMKQAVEVFTSLRKSTPAESPEAQRLDVLIGMSYYGLALYSNAVPLLKAAAQRDQQNSPLLLALAHSCLWSNQLQCVMDAYHQILALNAESAEADMLAGEALDQMQDSDGAIKMFREAVAANPKEPDVHFGLGYLLWTQKRYPDALLQFQAELENDPNHAQSLVYLGDSYLQLNNPSDALAPLQKGLALDPSLWIASLDLGIIDSDAGRNDDALRELRKALALKPTEVNVHWRLARLLRTMGRTEEAKVEFEKAKTLNKTAADDLHKQIANGSRQNRDNSQTPQTMAAPAQ